MGGQQQAVGRKSLSTGKSLMGGEVSCNHWADREPELEGHQLGILGNVSVLHGVHSVVQCILPGRLPWKKGQVLQEGTVVIFLAQSLSIL